jgi:hypothetical protein
LWRVRINLNVYLNYKSSIFQESDATIFRLLLFMVSSSMLDLAPMPPAIVNEKALSAYSRFFLARSDFLYWAAPKKMRTRRS